VPSRRVLSGIVSSDSPPTRTSHSVVPAMATHRRVARSASVRRVRCHGPPPRLATWKLGAIQARNPYQAASLASGGRSVTSSHGSWEPWSQRANKVPSRRRGFPAKAVPRPAHEVPGSGTKVLRG
jgi:hypothetical protein